MSSFAFERYEPFLRHIVAQNWVLYFILGVKFWSKVKKSKFTDSRIFWGPDFEGPWTGPKMFFGKLEF